MSVFKSLDNVQNKEDEEQLTKTYAKFSTIEYRYDSLVQGLENNTLNNAQICSDILNNYINYCDYDNFKNSNTRKQFQYFWSNKTFLNCFKKVLPNFKNNLIDYYNKSICKIAYDYYVEKGMNIPNDEVTRVLFDIVEIINHYKILPLTTFIKPIDALFIVMANNSSFDEKECVNRTNEFIIKLGYDFSKQQIVDIYSLLYSKCFTKVFIHSLTKVYNENELTENQKIINNRISVVLLEILENMPTQEISQVLKSYDSYIELNNSNTRFNLRSKLEESKNLYPRVYNIINNLY